MAEFVNTIDVVGDDALVDSIITGTITEFKDDTVITIGYNMFYGCASLVTVDIPAVTEIQQQAFRGCSKLVSVNIPNVTVIDSAFYTCQNLTKVDAPRLVAINGWSAF